MEILTNLYLGFDVAFSLTNILYCLAGVSIGTLVGVLPGIGPMASISILLPLMYSIGDPITSIIFLAGIYYGTQYGGSTSSILLNLPGEAASTITALDGYKLTKSGRGGAALAIAALSSFFAGTVTAVTIALVSVPLSAVAFMFSPADYASLMVLGLLASVAISQGSFLKGLGMVLVGILLGTVGTDINSGTVRFTFGNFYLADGISFVVIAMAVFGLAEIVYNIFHEHTKKIIIPSLKDLYPTHNELKKSLPAMTRGTVIGGILGILPGAGAILSSFCSYIVEKSLKKNKSPNGDIEAVAGPEAANNAGAQMSFVPMLALGIPTTAVMSLILAALMMNNIQPGPQVIENNPGLFWGLIVSMWIGNFFLLILNYPLVGVWVSFLKVPRYIMYPIILLACAAGAYYVNNNWFEVWLLIPFMIFGYVLKLLDCEPAPLAMGFVIGTMFEEYLRRSLSISRGEWMIFLDKPISLGFLSITLIFIAASVIIKSKKKL